jgi:RNA polymerase sigma factor (sigma-70 family)
LLLLSRVPQSFEEIFLPHFGAAYNLARWLTGVDSDAEDLCQDAYLKAFASFENFRGANPKSWLLAIVRNTCFDWLRKRRPTALIPFDDELAASDASPETLYLRELDRHALKSALARLPAEFQEVLILREFEDLSYKEISEIAGLPIGTVMSRLARARQRLRSELSPELKP